MPKFEDTSEPDAYLTWELKVEKIFCVHNYSEEKVHMAAHDGYALIFSSRTRRRSAYHCNLSSRTCRRKRLAIVWRPTKTSAYGSSSLTITRGVRRKRFAFSLSDSSAIVCDDTR